MANATAKFCKCIIVLFLMTSLLIGCGGSSGGGDGDGDNGGGSSQYELALGDWSGDDISFTVTEGSYFVNNLSVTYRGHADGTICNYDYENGSTIGASIPVIDNKFSYNSSSLTISGEFISETSVEVDISWSTYDSHCDATESGDAHLTANSDSGDGGDTTDESYSGYWKATTNNGTSGKFATTDNEIDGSITVKAQGNICTQITSKSLSGNIDADGCFSSSSVSGCYNSSSDKWEGNWSHTISTSYVPGVPQCWGSESGTWEATRMDKCEPDDLTVTADLNEIPIDTGASTITAMISAAFPDYCTQGVADGTQVDFEISDPDSTGSSFSSFSATTTDGQAMMVLNAGSTTGTVTVTVTVEDSEGNTHSETIDISVTYDVGIVGSIDTNSTVYDIYVVGSYAYVTDQLADQNHEDRNNGGLKVIDISDPKNPTMVGSVNTPGAASGVCVDGTNAFVADQLSGLQVIDISDPSDPNIVGSVTTSQALGVYASGSYAYVADKTAGLRVVNISDPSNPSIIGTLNTSDWAYAVHVVGSYAYVADDLDGLKVINVSDPADPDQVGSYNTSQAWDVYVVEPYAYVADASAGLKIIDISDPTDPNLVASVDSIDADDVHVVGSYAYVADSDAGLHVIDVTDTFNPNIVTLITTPGSVKDVYFVEPYAYVADGSSGIQVIDISNLP